MPTVEIPVTDSAWYVYENSTTKGGNGTGPRLQLGYVTPGADNWRTRIGLKFDTTGLIPAGAVITSATLHQKVRGTNSCFSKGGSAKISVERTTDADYALDISNAQGNECSYSTGGTIDQNRWGGPPTTMTDRAIYEGNPSVGTVIDIDITALFAAWWAVQTADLFTVVEKACDAAGDPDEANNNRRIAFDSDSGTTPPSITVVYSTNTPPTVGSGPVTPIGGVRQTGTASRYFKGGFGDNDVQYGDPTYEYMTSLHLVVATSSHVDGNGKLDTGVIYDVDSAATFSQLGPSGVYWEDTRSFTQTRGTTYYWQYAVTDHRGPAKSAWSSVASYKVNQLPTGTKVRPT